MLESDLANVLPKLAEPFQLHHSRTPPKKCRRLVYISKQKAKHSPLDTQSVHFFTLSYKAQVLYAIEIYVFESSEYMTVFVSKADTTGHYYEADKDAISFKQVSTILLRVVLREYVNTPKPVRLCLFAKSASRYLFPESDRNPKKHVLKDTGLVKWWAKVLDPLADEFEHVVKANLQIPGSDSKSIEACFPDKVSSQFSWSVGDIFGGDATLPAVKCIPRFPDDPKTRFLDYLVAEKRALKTSRAQFWLELPSRQEFRLGSVVGIIGIEGSIKLSEISGDDLTPTVSNQAFLNIYECIMGLDFSSKDKAEDSSAMLLEQFANSTFYEIHGERPPIERGTKRVEVPVNMLGAGLIRKKKK